MKKFALLLFYTAGEIGDDTLPPNVYVLKNVLYFDNGIQALNAYANTRCPASQIVEGSTNEELEKNIREMVINYSNEEWLNENLYPYL